MGNFKAVLLNRTISTEAVLRNIAGNVTVIIFQIHSHQKNVTVSFDKVFVLLLFDMNLASAMSMALHQTLAL